MQLASTTDDGYINPDRPGLADGSGVVGSGRFQVEAGLQYEYRKSGTLRTQFVPVLVRLGIADSLEVRLEGNTFTRTRSVDVLQGSIQSEGMAPSSIGLKYRFLESDETHRPSLAAILRVFPGSGSGNFRTTRTMGDFRLAADWDFAPQWSLNPNLGIAVYSDADAQRSYTAGLFAVTLNYNPTPTLNLFVDAGAQYPEASRGKASLVADVGMAWIIGRNLQFDFSAGTGVTGTTPPRLFLSAGISQRF